MHFWHTLHRHMHYAFMADTYQSWLSLAGSACLSEIFSTPTISGPSSSQLLEKDNIWMFTIFLDMLIWNKVTSLVDMPYQNYHTLTQRFCRQGTDIQFVFPKKSPTLSSRDSWRCWSWFQRFPPPPRCWASAWTKSPAGREQSGNRQYSSSLELQDAKRIQNHLRRKELTMPPRQEKVPIIKRGMILLIAPWIHLMDVAQ